MQTTDTSIRRIKLYFSLFVMLTVSAITVLSIMVTIQYTEIYNLKCEIDKQTVMYNRCERLVDSNLSLISRGGWEAEND